MRKPSIGSALTSSLRAEQKSVDQRFGELSRRLARADHALRETEEDESKLIERVRVSGSGAGQHSLILEDSETDEKRNVSSNAVVRANFSMPIADYDLISQVRDRCSRGGVILSQSEILRAGLHALQSLPLAQLLTLAKSIEHLKPGPVKKLRRSK